MFMFCMSGDLNITLLLFQSIGRLLLGGEGISRCLLGGEGISQLLHLRMLTLFLGESVSHHLLGQSLSLLYLLLLSQLFSRKLISLLFLGKIVLNFLLGMSMLLSSFCLFRCKSLLFFNQPKHVFFRFFLYF